MYDARRIRTDAYVKEYDREQDKMLIAFSIGLIPRPLLMAKRLKLSDIVPSSPSPSQPSANHVSLGVHVQSTNQSVECQCGNRYDWHVFGGTELRSVPESVDDQQAIVRAETSSPHSL